MIRVYYFTRTGDSRKIAESIASQTGGSVFAIQDHENWSGPAGYLRAGYYASSKKSVPADYEKPQDGDVIYLCFPVWAGSFPPAVRTFLSTISRDRIIAVPSSLGSQLKDQDGFIKVISVIGKDKTVHIQ
jgi:flavodoxin